MTSWATASGTPGGSITVEAVRQPGRTEGSNVTAVIKASDVILATSD